MGWKLTVHTPQGRTGPGNFTHSQDDGVLPDHWIVLLGDYVEQGEHVSLKVWSWGGEYELSGSVDSIEEYLFGVVIGNPH